MSVSHYAAKSIPIAIMSFIWSVLTYPFLLSDQRIYYPSRNGPDGLLGDCLLGLWSLYRFRNLSLSDSVDYWVSYPFGESVSIIQYVSQLVFFLPGLILQPLLGPVSAFNTSLLLHFTLTGFFGYFVSRGYGVTRVMCCITSLLLVSLPAIQDAIGGPTALTPIWPLLSLIIAIRSFEANGRLSCVLLVLFSLGVAGLTDVYLFVSCVLLLLALVTTGWIEEVSARTTRILVSVVAVILGIFILVRLADFGEFAYRTYNEWLWFGAQYWMYLSPRPLTGPTNLWITARDEFIGWHVLAALVVLIALRAMSTKIDARKLARLLACAFLIYFMTVVDHSAVGNFLPSKALHELIPVVRYTGRLSIGGSVLFTIFVVVVLDNAFCKLKQTIKAHRSSSLLLGLLLALLVLSTAIYHRLPQWWSPNRTADLNDVPSAYTWLSVQGRSPYIEVPGWGFIDPFPSQVFQYISNQPILDDIGYPTKQGIIGDGEVLARRLALLSTFLCDRQTKMYFKKLGFRYLLVHEDRWQWVSRSEIMKCGWRLVTTFTEEKTGFLNDQLKRIAIYEPQFSGSVAPIVIPSNDFEEVSDYQTLRSSFALNGQSGRLLLHRIDNHSEQIEIVFSIRGDSTLDLGIYSDCTILSITKTAEITSSLKYHYAVTLRGSCPELTLVDRNMKGLVISDFFAVSTASVSGRHLSIPLKRS